VLENSLGHHIRASSSCNASLACKGMACILRSLQAHIIIHCYFHYNPSIIKKKTASVRLPLNKFELSLTAHSNHLVQNDYTLRNIGHSENNFHESSGLCSAL
jgi:hypothetical protein